MKKGERLEGIVTSVKFPNKGKVVTENGEEATVKGVIPGQKVSFAVKKSRKGSCEGRLLEVLEPSAMELPKPACRHFGICGGCSYQNLSYEKQLALKESQVRELIQPVLKAAGEDFDALFEGIKESPKKQMYRNKMEFSFGDEEKGGPLTLGMHKKGSFYDITGVGDCRIVDEDFRRIVVCAELFFRQKGISYYHKLSHNGYLRHLLVRKAAKTGEILIDLVTSTQIDLHEETMLLQEFLEQILAISFDGRLVGVLHTKNDGLADMIRNDGTDILYGQDFFYEELLGLKFKITPFSFFQTNSYGAGVLYETVREYIGGSLGTVFDLYSGTGTIAQILAPASAKVIGVEIVEEAVAAAKENAALNGLSNCEFIVGDVPKVMDTIGEQADVIVLDPPRDGLHPKALEKFCTKITARELVYISCKPTSLARDLEKLLGSGYRVRRMCCVDMFPGTVHVETCVLLGRK